MQSKFGRTTERTVRLERIEFATLGFTKKIGCGLKRMMGEKGEKREREWVVVEEWRGDMKRLLAPHNTLATVSR
jgi:hypothetical protein